LTGAQVDVLPPWLESARYLDSYRLDERRRMILDARDPTPPLQGGVCDFGSDPAGTDHDHARPGAQAIS
jgi:hypothetical protein